MVKCKMCGETIIIFCSPDGAVHILDKPKWGKTDYHLCDAMGEYPKILSKSKLKELDLAEWKRK